MAGVFLSYDRDDTDKARPIALALEKAGHSVWWDLHVRGGAQFGKVIEEALKAADAVVVLWSKHSLESAWVKDEAAAGRDSGRLIPVSLDGVEPPLGFRQFQTIDLSGWRGRGKARLQPLLDSVATYAPLEAQSPQTSESMPGAGKRGWTPVLLASGALALLLGVGGGLWMWTGSADLPVVEVAAANASQRSQAAASDLFVKLGSLAQIGEGKWQLVDSSSAAGQPDLVFRTADVGSPQQPKANLVLLDGNDKDLLWSREFSFPAGGDADLRQQMSLTAGRVLGCALEARAAGGLRRDLLKLFLNACALLAETSSEEPTKVAGLLRTVVAGAPRFLPAWGRLIDADVGVLEVANYGEGDSANATRTLRADMEKARQVEPELPELYLAEIKHPGHGLCARSAASRQSRVASTRQSADIFASDADAAAGRTDAGGGNGGPTRSRA